MKGFWQVLFMVLCTLSLVLISANTEVEAVPKPRISAHGPGKFYYYFLTEEEKILVAKVVYAESRGEKFKGQVAVAATVMNRWKCHDRAIRNDSIRSVVMQRGAYASIKRVTRKQAMLCMNAVEQACKGFDPTRTAFPDGAKFFYAPKGIGKREMAKRQGVKKLTIDNHVFHNSFSR